jgi:hypothetical protein
MWVPDTRTPQFAEKVKQQARRLKRASSESETLAITDEAASKTKGWQ